VNLLRFTHVCKGEPKKGVTHRWHILALELLLF
jgi:hypothetical protein